MTRNADRPPCCVTGCPHDGDFLIVTLEDAPVLFCVHHEGQRRSLNPNTGKPAVTVSPGGRLVVRQAALQAAAGDRVSIRREERECLRNAVTACPPPSR